MKPQFDNNKEGDNRLENVAGKKNFFTTPNGYFETLHDEITTRISSRANEGTSRKPVFAFALYSVVIAVILIGSTLFIVNSNDEKKSMTADTGLYQDDAHIISSIDEQDLVEIVEINQKENEYISEFDYLIDNHTDLNLITTEL